MICASSSCPPGDEANTYSTILSPTPSADLGDRTLCDSEVVLKLPPLVGRWTMIGWDTACSDGAMWGTDGPHAVSLHCSPKKIPDVIPPWLSSHESCTSHSFFAVEAIYINYKKRHKEYKCKHCIEGWYAYGSHNSQTFNLTPWSQAQESAHEKFVFRYKCTVLMAKLLGL